MSASDKKKLRKEQNAAAMTEKQQKEQKEAKKLKTYTIAFVVVMVLVVAIVIGATLRSPIAGMIDRGTHAVTVGNRELSTAELNYYYVDAISAFYSQFSSYGNSASMYMQIMTGLIPTTPLDKQVYDETTGQTWADYFVDQAKTSAKWTYIMYEKAIAEGFKLSASDQEFLDNFEDNMKLYAEVYGFSGVGGYLRSMYGDGANMKEYKEYYTQTLIASEYATQYRDSLEFTDEDYRAYEKDKYEEFSSYNYATYYISVNSYLTLNGGGTSTPNENGTTSVTYTDEQKAAARDAAKKAAESLAVSANNSLEKLNVAINRLDINKDKDKDVEATEVKNALHSSITNEDYLKWLSDSARKEGDITFIENKSGSGEDETVNGYTVLLFVSSTDNKTPLANVQHVLIQFEGGTTNSTTGETTYTDAQKAAAKKEAEILLEDFKDGEISSEAFAELAKKHSDDSGSSDNGGLIEGIHPDSNYVESFEEWALAGHKPGDTGIIESPYGYHIMYYKEDGDMTYRDYLINNALIEETYTEWEKALLDTVTVTDVNLSGIDRDFIIAS